MIRLVEMGPRDGLQNEPHHVPADVKVAFIDALSRSGLPEIERYITFGASPRASINLILTGRALAFVRGRDYVLPDDVLDMALDVLRHRLVLSFEALSDGITSDALLRAIIDRVPVPVVPLREHDRLNVSA